MSQDSQLQQDVLAEFKWEPSVTAGHIGVTAKNGVVTLSGHVDSYAQKFAAETAARRVKGVKGVAEEIEVKLPFKTSGTMTISLLPPSTAWPGMCQCRRTASS